MATNSAIFTNRALKKMKDWGISEKTVLDVVAHGRTEKSSFGGRWNAVKKYHGYEIGINYDQKQDGRYVIISAWKRQRR